MKRIAVVGSGIAGLAAARALASAARVTLFEAGSYFGGHSNTVDVTLDGCTHGVDTGFLVFNERTYPKLVQLFSELGVETARSEMSFSVRVPAIGLEWSGSSLDTVFAQRRNIVRPAFWRMLADVVRFNRIGSALAIAATRGDDSSLHEPVGDFLDRHRFSNEFRAWYLLPMIGSIWTCPCEQMMRFPTATLIRFCHNHGLLQLTDRPQWWTVRGGARRYVAKMVEAVADRRLRTPVRGIRRRATGGVDVATDAGSERFDAVVLACHSDQSLALLADPSDEERHVLGAIRYHANRAVLHTDRSVLPRRRKVWAAWNYERASRRGRGGSGGGDERSDVCLHYLVNRLQPLPFATPIVVTLNPLREPAPARVLGEFHYAHPVFDGEAVRAQARLPALQGRRDTWFCGAWTGYGFHEDGLASGLDVAARIVAGEAATALRGLSEAAA